MLNVAHIIQSGGLVLLGLFLFAEVGLFLGFFLPGDTLLIAAGIYAMQGKFSIVAVVVVAAIAAVLGDSLAFFIGSKAGPRIFTKDDSILFRKEHIEKAEAFFQKHGSKTVLIAHFLPVIRTFTPLSAGVARMSYKRYLSFDIIGDTAWALIISLAGYYVGSKIPNVDHYILLALGIIVIISVGPTLIQISRLYLKKGRKAKGGRQQ